MTLKFKTVAKDRLFYNQWEFCMSFRLEEISAAKKLDHDYIDDVIQHRRDWRELSRQRRLQARKAGLRMPPYFNRIDQDITEVTVNNLHIFAQTLVDSAVRFKLVTSVHRGWLYTNDPQIFNSIKKLAGVTNTRYTQAQVVRASDTILLKNPKYPLRSYFRSIKLTAQDRDLLKQFLHNQQTNTGLSPSLTQWLIDPFYRLQDYYFVDHDELWLTMLALVRPGLIRKTVTIAAR